MMFSIAKSRLLEGDPPLALIRMYSTAMPPIRLAQGNIAIVATQNA